MFKKYFIILTKFCHMPMWATYKKDDIVQNSHFKK